MSRIPTSRCARLFLVVLFWIVGTVPPDASAGDGPAPWRILVLHSYHADFVWSEDIMKGIHNVFDEARRKTEFYIEYLDAKRFPKELSPKHLGALEQHLKDKYATRMPHIILSTDDDALRFLLDRHKAVFPGVPIVFCGVNHPVDDGRLAAAKVVTGVMEVLDRKATLDTALALHPGTKNVAVVTDTTTTGMGNRIILKELAKTYAGRVRFVFLNADAKGITVDTLRKRMAALGNDTIVYYSDFFRDRNGFIDYAETLQLLSRESRRPIYTTYSLYMGHGIVGGKVNSALFQGEAAAKMALRILSGTPPAQIPVMKQSINPYMFDYRQLQRWGIPADRLPPGSIVLYKPVSFFQEHRGLVFGTAFAFLLLLGTIAALVVNIQRRKEAESSLREREAQLRLAVEGSGAGLWDWKILTGEVVFNEQWARIIGYELQELMPANIDTYVRLAHPDDLEEGRVRMRKHWSGQSAAFECEIRTRHKDGRWVWTLDRGRVTQWSPDGKPLRMTGTRLEVTERKQMEEDLQESEEKFSKAFQTSPYGIAITRPEDGKLLDVNDAFTTMTGFTREEALGATTGGLDLWVDKDERKSIVADLQALRPVVAREVRFRTKAGVELTCLYSAKLIQLHYGPSILSSISDITDRKREAQEKEKLQGQLVQAQKMESVGRLAGGVAHDFNNMLAVILGHTEMAMDELDAQAPLYADLREIKNAAERSANLTRQLLAFARKQTIAPRVLDLNDTVEGMLKMLRRLIGEDIDLAWLPQTGLPSVEMDPSQIDQILANLCINARDAIDGVGKVTIETSSVRFDDAYCADHPGHLPGSYVLLAISDNGCGMDKQTQAKLFEPFFTTKEMGKGTGLGLATVYGIVKQNNGFIHVYSEPGQGTTFRIYLNPYSSDAGQTLKDEPSEPSTLGNETILLVEDEPALLEMTARMLRRQGYRVLAASGPGEALRLADEHAGTIHLLLSDVVMPEMSGRDLAQDLLTRLPGLKCLYISGYTPNVIVHHGVLDRGVHFLPKPFSAKDLTARVREALEDGNG